MHSPSRQQQVETPGMFHHLMIPPGVKLSLFIMSHQDKEIPETHWRTSRKRKHCWLILIWSTLSTHNSRLAKAANYEQHWRRFLTAPLSKTSTLERPLYSNSTPPAFKNRLLLMLMSFAGLQCNLSTQLEIAALWWFRRDCHWSQWHWRIIRLMS
jgi:hypothetical protein